MLSSMSRMHNLVSRQGCCSLRLGLNQQVSHTCCTYLAAAHRQRAKKCSLSQPRRFPLRASNIGELALVNVDYVSPSLWLGIVLAVTGMVLYSLKIRNARGTQEVDIVAASLFVTCGGVLILQGWRLDPTLMLSEGVLAAVSIYYMIQTVTLRKELEEQGPPADVERWAGRPRGDPFPRQSELPTRQAQWSARVDRRDTRYIERGQQWDSYDEGLMFEAPYRSHSADQDLPHSQGDVYPYDREEMPRQASRPERRSYGVESSSPDNLVPTDDWNKQPPQK